MIPLAHDFTGETVLVFGGGTVGARKARRFAREARVVVVSPRFADVDFGGGTVGADAAAGDAGDPGGAPAAVDDSGADSAGGDDPGADSAGGDGPGTADADGSGTGDSDVDSSGPDGLGAGDSSDTDHSDAGGVDLVRAAPEAGAIPDWIERTDPALVVAATDDESLNDAIAGAARERGALVNRADRDARDGEWAAGDVAVPATVRADPVVVAISTGGASPALARALRERIEDDLAGAGEMAELTADLRDRLVAEGFDPEDRRAAVRAVVRSPEVWTALRGGAANHHEITEAVVTDVLEDR